MTRNQILLIALIALIIYAIMENDPRIKATNENTSENIEQMIENEKELSSIDESTKSKNEDQLPSQLNSKIKSENKSIEGNKPPIKPKKRAKQVPAPVIFEDAFIAYNSLSIPTLRIKVKNISEKSIDAIKCKIECFNRFDEKMINPLYNTNVGFITCENIILPNEIGCGLTGYTLDWQEGTTKVKIRVTKVHFEDGSLWEPSGNNQIKTIAKTIN